MSDAYPAILTEDDNDTLMVTFPDFPEAATFGEGRDDALARAHDALATTIMARMRDRQSIPRPSRSSRRRGAGVVAEIRLGSLATAKVELYRVMRAADVRKADLARRLGCDPRQVDRLLDLRHGSRLDQIDQALASLGKRLDLRLRAA